MKNKLELAKERKARKEQDRQQILALIAEIKAFNEILNSKEDIDLTELKTQLVELPELIAVPINKSLERFVKSLETHLSNLSDQNNPDILSKLIEDIKIENNIDLEVVAKEISKLKALASKKAVKPSQLAQDYLPYRRVVKMGTRFYFDDNMTSSGGGGGTDTSNLAKENKQDDIIVQLQALRGFQIPVYDEIAVTYPTTSSELYTYKLSSSDVATITVTYSDDTKVNLTGVVFSAS